MESIKELKSKLRFAREKAFRDARTKAEVIEIWEQDKRCGIPKSAKMLFCSGCRQNFYNGREEGDCWSLSKAKMKRRKIYASLDSTKPDKVVTLGCFVKQYH